MIESLIQADQEAVRLVHVPMRFSSSLEDVGVVRPGKVVEMIRVIAQIWRTRLRGARTLYYPPSGPNLIPIVRDITILLATRWAFRTLVFHFHASGLSEAHDQIPLAIRPLYRAAFRAPDLAIRPSPSAARDGRFFGARRDVVVYYGIEDPAIQFTPRIPGDCIRLLSVGALREGKGTDILITATAHLLRQGLNVRLQLVGGFFSPEDQVRITELITELGVADCVELSGVLMGDAKARAYDLADIFCFPTHYDSEAAPIVLIEAMAHGLPIVATRWRGIPDVVDCECAQLIEPQDVAALVEVLDQLSRDPEARAAMGAAGRKRYETTFTADIYRAKMTSVVAAAASE